MRPLRKIAALLCLVLLPDNSARALPTFPTNRGESIIRLPSLPEEASPDEVRARLHCLETPQNLDVSKDAFQIVLPASYQPDGSWGLFVWISASDNTRLPAEWLAVLEKHKLVTVSALKAGNQRNILDRIQLGVTAAIVIPQQLPLDPSRVWVSGFSGGARVASMLGVAYGDLFRGTIPFMGVNFYTDLPTQPGGKKSPPQFIPNREVLEIAKREGSFVLVTSDSDFNREETQIVFQKGFQAERFQNVSILQASGIGHQLPAADWLEKALVSVDLKKRSEPEKAPKTN